MFLATGTPKNAVLAQNDYRNIIILTEKTCSKSVLNAFKDGTLRSA